MVKIIENYTLHQQIGEGQYGKVYRGIDTRNGKQVAAKVINVKRFKDNPKLQQCTLNQIQVLTKIDSPHIVKFIQILKTINNFYFFYEFCNGGTLDQQIKIAGVLNEEKIISFIQQLLQAFKILSANNIMHRDLKPTNILIHNGKIKLGDFGFCKSLQNQRDLAQTMLGSPIYMAPQVLKGQIYTIKADIWSLGVVVYQMCFGFCPFQQSSIARLINVLQHQQIIFNRQINPISSSLQNLIRKMLIKDHFKRITWQELFAINLNFNKPIKKINNDPISHHHRALSQFNKNPRSYQLYQNEKSNKLLQQNKFMKKKKQQEQNNKFIENLHQNIANIIKLVNRSIQYCQNQENIFPVVVKIYKIISSQHQKLGSTKQYVHQRAQINSSIMQIQNLMMNEKGIPEDIQKMLNNMVIKDSKYTDLITYLNNYKSNLENTNFIYLNHKTLEKILIQIGFIKN